MNLCDSLHHYVVVHASVPPLPSPFIGGQHFLDLIHLRLVRVPLAMSQFWVEICDCFTVLFDPLAHMLVCSKQLALIESECVFDKQNNDGVANLSLNM